MRTGPYIGSDGFTVEPVHVIIKGRALREAANTAVDALTTFLAACERTDTFTCSLVDQVRDGAGEAEPTYVPGSSEKVYALSTMPTRYIVNCVRMSDARLAAGIRRELHAELQRRNDRVGG